MSFQENKSTVNDAVESSEALSSVKEQSMVDEVKGFQTNIQEKKARAKTANAKRLAFCYAEQLRKCAVARVNTFKKYGLNLDHVGIGVDDTDGDVIDIFLEVSSTESFYRRNTMLSLKANCYDKDDLLLAMDETYMDLNKFSGYNTYRISIWRKRIAKNTKRLVIYTAE